MEGAGYLYYVPRAGEGHGPRGRRAAGRLGTARRLGHPGALATARQRMAGGIPAAGLIPVAGVWVTSAPTCLTLNQRRLGSATRSAGTDPGALGATPRGKRGRLPRRYEGVARCRNGHGAAGPGRPWLRQDDQGNAHRAQWVKTSGTLIAGRWVHVIPDVIRRAGRHLLRGSPSPTPHGTPDGRGLCGQPGRRVIWDPTLRTPISTPRLMGHGLHRGALDHLRRRCRCSTRNQAASTCPTRPRDSTVNASTITDFGYRTVALGEVDDLIPNPARADTSRQHAYPASVVRPGPGVPGRGRHLGRYRRGTVLSHNGSRLHPVLSISIGWGGGWVSSGTMQATGCPPV